MIGQICYLFSAYCYIVCKNNCFHKDRESRKERWNLPVSWNLASIAYLGWLTSREWPSTSHNVKGSAHLAKPSPFWSSRIMADSYGICLGLCRHYFILPFTLKVIITLFYLLPKEIKCKSLHVYHTEIHLNPSES